MSINKYPAGLTAIKTGDSASIDAFARLRVSNPQTIFDSTQLFDASPLLWDDQEVSGAGTTSTHSTNTASTTMGVALNTAGNRVRQTFMRFNYQPGKSQLIFMTCVLDHLGGGTGITRGFGAFNDGNGVFLRDNEGTLEFVIRSSTTGSAVDDPTTQSNWNLDTLDGNGSSGITLDPTQAQILVMDFEWLGVGRVRFGFVIDGIPIYCHEVLNANNTTEVYMSTPNLPLRYEIENDGTGAASEIEHICSTIISEGGVLDTGIIRYKSTEGTHLDANVANTIYAVVGIQLKSGGLDCSIKVEALSVINATADDFEWLIILNPTVASTFTYSDLTNSCIQTAVGVTANTVTNGTVLLGGMVKSSNQGGGSISVADALDNAIRIGSAIDGTPDTLVLCVRPLSANADIEGSIAWRELSV